MIGGHHKGIKHFPVPRARPFFALSPALALCAQDVTDSTAIVDPVLVAEPLAFSAQLDPTALLSSLSVEYGVATADLEALMADGYEAGELRLALGLSAASGKTLAEIIALADAEKVASGSTEASGTIPGGPSPPTSASRSGPTPERAPALAPRPASMTAPGTGPLPPPASQPRQANPRPPASPPA